MMGRFSTVVLAMTVLGLTGCESGSSADGADDASRILGDALPADAPSAFIDVREAEPDALLADADFDASEPDCVLDSDCSDGVFCNGVERCSQGRCYASPVPACEDRVTCTVESCEEEAQTCTSVPSDDQCPENHICDRKIGCYPVIPCEGDPDCDDGNACNGVESCFENRCVPGRPIDCNDDILCTVDVCVDETGDCENLPVHARCIETELCSVNEGCVDRPPCMRDDDCDDGSFCNGTETCDAETGACIPGEAPIVDDGVPCTIDVCSDQLAMVVHTPTPARCSDGLFCNGAEVCHPVDGCQAGVPPALSDGVGCTMDRCDEDADFIEHIPNPEACDDGLFCNGTEVCHPIDGCQAGEPVEVNDNVGCTIDSCSEVERRVVHQVSDAACDDALFCNGTERCDPVADCQPGEPPPLDDGIPCTVDRCDEQADQVVHEPDHTRCDNTLFCDGIERCLPNEGCVAGTAPDIDDGIVCTVDACDEEQDRITHLVDHQRCDDGLFCNGRELCDPGADCVDGPAPRVSDGLDCTTDRCDEALDLIVHEVVDARCDDGLFCNGQEVCDGALGCVAGPRPVLDDGVNCTTDRCDEVADVVIHQPVQAACDDGLFCNGAERCDVEQDCIAGSAPQVDDGIPCTIDRCDENLDLVTHTPSQAACDDGQFCNGAEQCDPALGCRAGPAPHIDDGVRCTQDRCDEDRDAVVHEPLDALCDDGSVCNGTEFCDVIQGCLDGAAPADGLVCRPQPRSICLDERCDLSICGDGFVDVDAGEQCEDGNAVDGDGCNAQCRREPGDGGGDDRYSGIFDVVPDVNWSCGAFGIPLVTVRVDTFGLLRAAGRLEVTSRPGPSPPTMAQVPAPDDGRFSVESRVDGGCTEIYRLSGQFDEGSLDLWSGTLSVCFEGPQCGFTDCTGCTQFEVRGSRLRE